MWMKDRKQSIKWGLFHREIGERGQKVASSKKIRAGSRKVARHMTQVAPLAAAGAKNVGAKREIDQS